MGVCIVRIIVDGDACPSIILIEYFAIKNNLELIIFCDFSHNISSECGKVIKTDSSYQSVDIKIMNYVKENDIVITNDYGLAAICLNKKCYTVSFSGLEYTKDNIDKLLESRHLNLKNKYKNSIKKRTEIDDINLMNCLDRIKGGNI